MYQPNLEGITPTTTWGWLSTLKIAVLAPMAGASDSRATAVKPGFFRNTRSA